MEGYKKFFEAFHVMDRSSQTDPMTGISYTWTRGAAFQAGITTDNSTQALIAYQQGAKVIYTIVIEQTMTLNIGDRIERDSTGEILKITSDPQDMKPPVVSKMRFMQCTAEVVK